MNPSERLIQTAQSYVGYFGKKTNSDLDDFNANKGGLYNKFARDLDALGDWFNGPKNGYDWCDVFVDAMFYYTFGKDLALKLTCQPLRSAGAGTKYSMNYYKAKNQFYTYWPKPGDQIFFNFTSNPSTVSHTGIVKGSDQVYVYTIEGNSGSPSAVRECRYLLTYKAILGYGRPDWKLVPPEKNESEDDDDMTYYKTLNDVPDYYKTAVEKAMKKGALQGTGNNEINVSSDLCRTLTILDRLGKLD